MKRGFLLSYLIIFFFRSSAQGYLNLEVNSECGMKFNCKISMDTVLSRPSYYPISLHDTFIIKNNKVLILANNIESVVFDYKKVLHKDTFLFYKKAPGSGFDFEICAAVLDTVFNIDSLFPIFRLHFSLIRVNSEDLADINKRINSKYIFENFHHKNLTDFNPVLGFLDSYAYYWPSLHCDYTIQGSNDSKKEAFKIMDKLR